MTCITDFPYINQTQFAGPLRRCTLFLFLSKKENVTFMILEVTFEQKKIQFFRRCQNDGCKVSQLYYLVSKQPPNFLYEIINSKREKKPTKIYKNHKIGKPFLLCSLACYRQHFMSRSLSTKTVGHFGIS